ncbi:glycerol-3-phosphate 1-O-acyltransferase PlsY [Methylobrevis pamukkalensis]|uniref:Glycerol-3-phosphate acyltransferase n=1 Tax=Methylobrevis pamukkalensis TaxID=1439726 RepID=A0A1E3H611_9HYPH|nr:glycerol-3-phosphate 1-O-acyltransferase PlsY [Methylobrevis pamukkalensis]ODN71750.1 putative glycerol-3-phosphate acyltransferase [Methylobrevis pamukkalensis]
MTLDATTWPMLIAALAGGYLLGSIPFGLIFTKMAGLGDIRAIGSGNIGATNVLRTGRKGLALATVLGDGLKGTVAVLIAASFGPALALAAGLGAFLGHLFPVWLKFRGGKGVATYIGILLGFLPLAVLVFAAFWISVAYLSRYSSLAALIATGAMPAVLWALGRPELALLFLLLTALVWIRHHGNISKLLAGTENRIGAKKS